MLRAQLETDGVDPSQLDEIDGEIGAQLTEHERRGLAAPWPEPRAFSEFKD
jgi:hypothetical protein